jgi:hypothetical protein
MPYTILEYAGVNTPKKYSVENKNTKHLFSKGTTLSKAKAQMRLLYKAEKLKKSSGMP